MRTHSTLLLIGVLGIQLATPVSAANLALADLTPGDLVITEFLANPVGVADTEGEYFEILNRTTSTVDLAGLVVRDDGSNTFTVDALSLAPGGFGVLGNGDGAALGLTVDHIYGSSMSLTNSADEIVLVGEGDATLFRLAYADGDAFGAGVASELGVARAGLTVTSDGDYTAATSALLLGNLGSPGAAGGTTIPTVPLPGAAWLLFSGLAWLGSIRQRMNRRPVMNCAGSAG